MILLSLKVYPKAAARRKTACLHGEQVAGVDGLYCMASVGGQARGRTAERSAGQTAGVKGPIFHSVRLACPG